MNTTSTEKTQKKNFRHRECVKGEECMFLKQKRCFFWHPRSHRVCNKDGSCENPRCEFKHPKQGKKPLKGQTYAEYAKKIRCMYDGDCWRSSRGVCPFKHLITTTECIVIPKPKKKIESKVSAPESQRGLKFAKSQRGLKFAKSQRGLKFAKSQQI
jgi:hypothetical protein